MAIPVVMQSKEIKASKDYLNYLAKSTGTQPVKVKGRGKGLLTKKGVEVVVETVRILKKRRSETVIEETGQSKEVAYTIDSEETEDDEEEHQLTRRRQTGVIVGIAVHTESDERTLDHSKKLKGVETMSETAQYLLEIKQAKVSDEPRVDDDDMDNQFDVEPYLKKRRHDDQDPPADADKDTKKRRKDSDATSSKKSKDKEASSKEGKAPSKSSKTDKAMDAEETVQDDAMDVEELIEDDFVDTQEPTQDDAAPKQDRSKWFKQDVVETLETPDPEWCKEPNADDAPE
ncbi:hypothetical protein Tco_0683162 [Tanacetum coccineum]|uniref:DNA/RNA-binding protein Alba-like domain-containing protein n=1 Tax=Tanacetum coccineum TaxID=301880 RepID=A0ABQ4XTB5_9ASTR